MYSSGCLNKYVNKKLKVPTKVKLLLRLLSFHNLDNLEINECKKVYVDGKTFIFKPRVKLVLKYNVKCLIFTEETIYENSCFGKSLIFAFNWFSPKGFADMICLGMRLLVTREYNRLDTKYNMTSKAFMAYALEFMYLPEMQNFLEDNAAHYNKIMLTGFSMGGAISQSLAILLKEEQSLYKDKVVTVISFASPRPGNSQFTAWFEKNLTPDSMNIILTEETEEGIGDNSVEGSNKENIDVIHNKILLYDPVACRPGLTSRFSIHPRLHIMVKQDRGYMGAVHSKELKRLQNDDSNDSEFFHPLNLFNFLFETKCVYAANESIHSLLKYYENV